ncbi:MAG TPA: hypothetical protein VFD74_06260, partial [Thermoleophilia bacterium]|nr:hypothetical protein [Thermoleophilia bacterium]
ARRKRKEGDSPGAEAGGQPAPVSVSASDLATYFLDVAPARTAQALGDRVGAALYVEPYVVRGDS